MKIEYIFSCKTEPHFELSATHSGEYMIAITGAPNSAQTLLISYNENDPTLVPGVTINFGFGGSSLNGNLKLPRLHQLKQVIRAFQGMLILQTDLEVDFRHFKVKADNLELHSRPIVPTTEKKVDNNFVVLAASLAPKLQEHEVCLSFWRLGWRANDEGSTLEAFYYWWFFLEKMFGNGKWREKELVPHLLSSEILNRAVTAARAGLCGAIPPALSSEQQTIFIDGDNERILSELFRLRGKLHHAQPRSPWHPNEHEQYRFETAFLGMICQHCLKQLIAKVRDVTT